MVQNGIWTKFCASLWLSLAWIFYALVSLLSHYSGEEMRIWFDLSNSPHINFFYSLIRDLEKEHEIIITCRPLANTIDLLKLHKLPFVVIGRHYGAKLSSKISTKWILSKAFKFNTSFCSVSLIIFQFPGFNLFYK